MLVCLRNRSFCGRVHARSLSCRSRYAGMHSTGPKCCNTSNVGFKADWRTKLLPVGDPPPKGDSRAHGQLEWQTTICPNSPLQLPAGGMSGGGVLLVKGPCHSLSSALQRSEASGATCITLELSYAFAFLFCSSSSVAGAGGRPTCCQWVL